jgi:hypothetical protein
MAFLYGRAGRLTAKNGGLRSGHDWKRFYRQLAKPIAELWHQVLWVDGEGMRIDGSVTFGDGAGPVGCHVGEDIFLALIAHEFAAVTRGMPAWTDAQWSSRGMSKRESLAALVVLAEWAGERCELLRAAYPVESADPAWLERQAGLHVLMGFFDDSLLATAEALFDELVRAVLVVAEDLGLEVAVAKVLCGTTDGRKGTLDAAAWADKCEIRWIFEAGHLDVLGKMFDLSRQIVYDGEERLLGLEEAVDRMVQRSSRWADGRRVRWVADLRSVIGGEFFVAQTCPQARGLLNQPVKALRVSETVMPALNARYRATRKRGGQPEPAFAKFFFGKHVEEAVREVLAVARKSGGVRFNPDHTKPGTGGRRVVWVMADAAGRRIERHPDGTERVLDVQGGGGAWIIWAGGAAGQDVLRWYYRAWTAEELEHSSTWLEAVNANRLVAEVLAAGAEDVVVCLDNQAWTGCAQRLSCRSEELVMPVLELTSLVGEFP